MLSPFDYRSASAQCSKAWRYWQLIANAILVEAFLPTDGTRAAAVGTGDFGTSPIFEQFSEKQLPASMFIKWNAGTESTMADQEKPLMRFDDGMFRCCGFKRGWLATSPSSVLQCGRARLSEAAFSRVPPI